MLDDVQHRVESISGPWWGVIAGAAVIGAILFPDARGTAAAVAGGVAFVVAMHQAPCCDSCAKGATCAGASSPASSAKAAPAIDAGSLFTNTDFVGRGNVALPKKCGA